MKDLAGYERADVMQPSSLMAIPIKCHLLESRREDIQTALS
jgi:hypothetical protein